MVPTRVDKKTKKSLQEKLFPKDRKSTIRMGHNDSCSLKDDLNNSVKGTKSPVSGENSIQFLG